MKYGFFSSVLVMFTTVSAFAHGEDKPGPHGGFIRMPGVFHTEVVAQSKTELRVYLLDIDWKNPSVKSSTVSAAVKNETTAKATCTAQKEFFVCTFGKAVDLTSKGQLLIDAKRENQTGAQVSYPLPLTLGKTSHQGH